MVKFIFVLAAATIVAAALAISWIVLKSRDPSKLARGFHFENGRLWASVSGPLQETALIDTATSMSIFPKRWESASHPTSSNEIASTPFGIHTLSVREVNSTYIGGIRFDGEILVGEARYPLIGIDFLFSKGNVLFTRSGLKFDTNYEEDKEQFCGPLITAHEGDSIHTPIQAIYFLLSIDGVAQDVLFDTGRAPTLTATAFAPPPRNNPFPWPNVGGNSLGDIRVSPYFSRTAEISFGTHSKIYSYKHFYRDRSVDAAYILGAEILNEYDVFVDMVKKRFCFLNI